MWNSEEPNEFIQLIQDEQQDMLYKTFEHSSLIVGLARWTKFFCYSFIIFQLVCVIIEAIFPFAVHSPDVFTQLLFLTLVWVMIEVLTIPVESIGDVTTIDYQKNWIALDQNRFFYRRNKVLASFNMIRAIGVSSRPPAIIPGLFSSTSKRFALIVQTYDDKIINVTDHSLTLDAANELCQELSQRLSGVTGIMGEPGMDLAVSGETRELVAVPCKRSILTLADAVGLISLKVVVSSATSILLLFLAIQIIITFAGMVFTTDLRLHNQPVMQLVFGSEKAKAQVEETLAPASAPSSIELARNPDLPAIWQASRDSATQSQLLIDPTQKSIKLDTITTAEPASDTELVLSQSESSGPDKVTETADPTPSQKSPDTVSDAEANAKAEVTVDEEESEAAQKARFIDEIVNIMAQPEKSQISEATAPESRVTIATPYVSTPPQPCYAPLISRIPSVDLTAIATPRAIKTETISSPVTKTMATTQATKKTAASCILPGYGIEPMIILGKKISPENLADPVFQYTCRKGTQKLFENYSILTDQNGIICEIIITSKNNEELKTPQNISIGSPIKALSLQYGPFTTSSDKPGIHYPRLGISFMPALHNPQIVGAIKIYKPSGKLLLN